MEPHLVTIGLTVFGAMSTALGYVWKQMAASNKEHTAKHDKAQGQIVQLTREIGELQGQMVGHKHAREDMRESLQELSRAALGKMLPDD